MASNSNTNAQVRLDVSLKIHPMEAVLSAANLLVGDCRVTLDKQQPGRVLVVLEAPSDEQAQALRERFERELLWETLRLKIARRTEPIRQLLLGRALLSAEPLDLAGDEDLSWTNEDYLEDPLGIAVPWEERFGAQAEETHEPDRPGRSPEDLADAKQDPSPPGGSDHV